MKIDLKQPKEQELMKISKEKIENHMTVRENNMMVKEDIMIKIRMESQLKKNYWDLILRNQKETLINM